MFFFLRHDGERIDEEDEDQGSLVSLSINSDGKSGADEQQEEKERGKQGPQGSIRCDYFVVADCNIVRYVIYIFSIIFFYILMLFLNCPRRSLRLGPFQIPLSSEKWKWRFSSFENNTRRTDGRTRPFKEMRI